MEKEQLLLIHGFKKTSLFNQFSNYRKIAVISKNGDVIITTYTPKTHRYLYSNTYYSIEELKNELEKNCPR